MFKGDAPLNFLDDFDASSGGEEKNKIQQIKAKHKGKKEQASISGLKFQQKPKIGKKY